MSHRPAGGNGALLGACYKIQMRQRIPRQRATKWWILLAAILAAGLTWLQHRDDPRRGEAPQPRSTRAAEAPDDGVVEFEITD